MHSKSPTGFTENGCPCDHVAGKQGRGLHRYRVSWVIHSTLLCLGFGVIAVVWCAGLCAYQPALANGCTNHLKWDPVWYARTGVYGSKLRPRGGEREPLVEFSPRLFITL